MIGWCWGGGPSHCSSDTASVLRWRAPHTATTSNNIPSNLCLRSDQHFMASRDSAESSSFNDQETSQETSQESVSSRPRQTLGPAHVTSDTAAHNPRDIPFWIIKVSASSARDSSPLISEEGRLGLIRGTPVTSAAFWGARVRTSLEVSVPAYLVSSVWPLSSLSLPGFSLLEEECVNDQCEQDVHN